MIVKSHVVDIRTEMNEIELDYIVPAVPKKNSRVTNRQNSIIEVVIGFSVVPLFQLTFSQFRKRDRGEHGPF